MHGTPATRSNLVAIPKAIWESGETGEIADVALAIERRKGHGVPLPRENARYPLVCDRLADHVRSLVENGAATTVWEANSADTARWIGFTFQVFRWAVQHGDHRIQDGVWRLRSTFVPPDRLGDVVAVFDEVIHKHLSSLSNGNNLRPLLERRLQACRSAGDSGIVELISFSPF